MAGTFSRRVCCGFKQQLFVLGEAAYCRACAMYAGCAEGSMKVTFAAAAGALRAAELVVSLNWAGAAPATGQGS